MVRTANTESRAPCARFSSLSPYPPAVRPITHIHASTSALPADKKGDTGRCVWRSDGSGSGAATAVSVVATTSSRSASLPLGEFVGEGAHARGESERAAADTTLEEEEEDELLVVAVKAVGRTEGSRRRRLVWVPSRERAAGREARNASKRVCRMACRWVTKRGFSCTGEARGRARRHRKR